MSKSIKTRILQDVRRRIEADADVNQYICFAIDTIEAADHRRLIHTLCAEIKAEVMQEIAPYKSVGDWLMGIGSSARCRAPQTLDDVKAARLKLIDKLIERTKA